jgi:hypothetical protein
MLDTIPSRKACALAKATILHTGRASRCALGEYLRRRCFFAPLREPVRVPQNTVGYRPLDQVRDALVGLLCGAKTMAQSHVTLRTAPAVQRALGRTGGADQSTIARTLRVCTPENVAPLARVSWYDRKRSGATPPQRFAARRRWVEVDRTPMPSGAQAAGSARPWMGRQRSTTGRKTVRITASAYRAILHATLRRGTASAVPALTTALPEVDMRLGWPRERRQRIVLRLAGGCGTTEILNWLRSRGSQVVAKSSPSGRGRTWRQTVGPWQPTSSPGRESAAVLHPQRCCRATRPWVIRTPRDTGGYPYAVLVTTLTDLEPAALAAADDGRARIEASCCQDTQALGLVTRRQRR